MQNKLIVALDCSTYSEAAALVHFLGDCVSFYKVGLELFLNAGTSILELLAAKKKKVFLDLKFHDIPNTIAASSRYITDIPGVVMFNVHATGGSHMIESAVAQKKQDQILLAVTLLTSFDQDDVSTIFQNTCSTLDFVLHLAKKSYQSGADGVVCSAYEASAIKKACGRHFLTVCPGIRIGQSETHDQKRVLSPQEAIRNGADYLVVGRSITQAKDPRKVVEQIFEEIDKGLTHASF